MTKKIAVLTGAGISTSAGIPDFRGPDGVWTKHPDQMSVYDIDLFLRNKEDREYSWRWQKESPVWNAQPGTAHKALVKLEQAGMLTLLATQNFDALHEKQQRQRHREPARHYRHLALHEVPSGICHGGHHGPFG